MSDCKNIVKLFFIRHGLSCSNYGREHVRDWELSDPFLSDVGIGDLEGYRKVIHQNHIRPDYVFSSSLLRAIQTAQILFPDKVVNVSPHINETHTVELPENEPSKPSRQLKYLNHEHVKYLYLGSGAEDLDTLFHNRNKHYDTSDFEKFLKWLTYKLKISLNTKKRLTIAVVGHGNFMQNMLINKNMFIDEKDKEKRKKLAPWNAAIVEMNLCKKSGKNLEPYTKNCETLKSLAHNSKYNYPCYGMKMLGFVEPDGTRISKNCEDHD